MRRYVDAPRKAYLSTVESARWLGLNREIFEATIADHPWMKPLMVGVGNKRKSKRWFWMDLVCLCWIMNADRQPDEQPDKKATGGGAR